MSWSILTTTRGSCSAPARSRVTTLPDHQFDKILFVEKTGLKTQLEPYRLAQKYDMAIIYSQGFSVVACRDLLASTESRRHADLRRA